MRSTTPNRYPTVTRGSVSAASSSRMIRQETAAASSRGCGAGPHKPKPFRTIVSKEPVWQPSSSQYRDASSHISTAREQRGPSRRSISPCLALRASPPRYRGLNGPFPALPPAVAGSAPAAALEHFWERLTSDHILDVVSRLPPREVSAFVARACHTVHHGASRAEGVEGRNEVLEFLRRHFGLRSAVASSKEPLVTSALVGRGRLPPPATWSPPVKRFIVFMQHEAREQFLGHAQLCTSHDTDTERHRLLTAAVMERVWLSVDAASVIASALMEKL